MSPILSKEELSELKISDLRERCKKEKIDSTGLKTALVLRLVEKYGPQKVNDDSYTTGVVRSWVSKGFGFIVKGDTLPEVAEGEEKPEELFFSYADVNMAKGENVNLRRGMSVLFKEGVDKKKKPCAKDVSNADGEPISWFAQSGELDREFIEVEGTGTIGQWDKNTRRGYVLPNEEMEVEGETIGINTKLNFFRGDVMSAKGERIAINPGREVSFQLYKYNDRYGSTQITDTDGNNLKPITITKGSEDVDEAERHTGRVMSFSTNNFGRIAADLSKYGAGRTIYFNATDINTEAQPPMVAAGMEVSFTLYKDDQGFGAKNVSMPDGEAITLPEGTEPKDYEEVMPRESLDAEYKGKVEFYRWGAGFGVIKVDTKSGDIPEEVKSKIKDGKVWFRWSDINSSDKIVGVAKDTTVSFSLYTDEKGVGAENICTEDGEPISGAEKPKFTGKRKGKWGNKGRKSWGKGKWNRNKRRRRW